MKYQTMTIKIKRIVPQLLICLALGQLFSAVNAEDTQTQWKDQVIGMGKKMCEPDAYETAKWQSANVTGFDFSIMHFKLVSQLFDQVASSIAQQPLTEEEAAREITIQQRNIEISNLMQIEKKYVYDNCRGYSYD